MIIKKSILAVVFLSLFLTEMAVGQVTAPQTNDLKALTEIDTTMWRFLSALDRSQWIITKADSEKAIRTYYFEGTKKYTDYTNLSKKIEKGKVTLTEVADDLIRSLVEAKDHFEAGVKLNPFDTYLRSWLSAVYSNLERFYSYKNDNQRHLQVLLNYLHLERDKKKQIDLYNKIGKIYHTHQLWEKTRDNFQRAVELIFECDDAVIDTTKLFDNIYYRGLAQLKLYQGEPARTSFTYARMISTDEKTNQTLTGWINYINWDDANIRASEQFFNVARRLYSEKKYAEAEKAYLDVLTIIQTERAKNEVQFRLSTVQFMYLDKKEEAVDRLWHVVKNFPLDPKTGAAIDSTQKDYWDTYCRMCVPLADSYLSKDKKISFAYFQKVSQIESSVRGSAFLKLAFMSRNNPDICLKYCDRTFEYLNQLNKTDQKTLYNFYYQANFRKGNFDEALKWFQKYQEI